MFEINENPKADAIIRMLGLSMFMEGKFEMTLLKKNKPNFLKGASACYSVAEIKTHETVYYIALYNKTSRIVQYDLDGKEIVSMTYDEFLGPRKNNF